MYLSDANTLKNPDTEVAVNEIYRNPRCKNTVNFKYKKWPKKGNQMKETWQEVQ